MCLSVPQRDLICLEATCDLGTAERIADLVVVDNMARQWLPSLLGRDLQGLQGAWQQISPKEAENTSHGIAVRLCRCRPCQLIIVQAQHARRALVGEQLVVVCVAGVVVLHKALERSRIDGDVKPVQAPADVPA